MDAAAVIAQLSAAYGQVGAALGSSYEQYRPILLDGAATAFGRNIATLSGVTFDRSPTLTFRSPSGFGKPEYYGAFDPRTVAAGDYLVGEMGTFFVAGLEPGKPALCVQCNATVTIARGAGLQAGLNAAYGGRTDATDVVMIAGWPASLISGGQSEAGRAELPNDPKRFGGAICKLPALDGVTFRSGDRVEVQSGGTYIVGGAFLQSLGWRLDLADAET